VKKQAETEQNQRSEASALPKISPMQGLPGSLHHQYVRCGKAGCRCAKGKLHGPYVYLFGWDGGRLWKRYVRKADVEHTRALVKVYRLGQRLQAHYNRVGWHNCPPALFVWIVGA